MFLSIFNIADGIRLGIELFQSLHGNLELRKDCAQTVLCFRHRWALELVILFLFLSFLLT